MSRRSAAALLAGALLVPVAAAPALAAEGDPLTGWWGRTGGLVPVPVEPPSPVPEGGTWVAADPSGPLAVSALRTELPAGVVATSLRLTVADALGTPAVQACPTTDQWVPEQGGRLEGAPFADCSTPLDAVVEGDVLVVSLPPAADQVNVLLRAAPGAVFSLTLERATAASVVTAPAAPTAPLPMPVATDAAAPQPVPAPAAPLPVALPAVLAPLPLVQPALAAPLPAPAVAGTPAPVPQVAPPALGTPLAAAVTADVPDARETSVLAAVLLAGLAAVAVRQGRVPATAPRALGGVARLRRADTPAAPPAPPSPSRGVGRFRSSRTRPPVRL